MKSVDQLAKELGKSPRWVRMQAMHGRYNAIKVSDTWIILEEHEVLVDLTKVSETMKKALLALRDRQRKVNILKDVETSSELPPAM